MEESWMPPTAISFKRDGRWRYTGREHCRQLIESGDMVFYVDEYGRLRGADFLQDRGSCWLLGLAVYLGIARVCVEFVSSREEARQQ